VASGSEYCELRVVGGEWLGIVAKSCEWWVASGEGRVVGGEW
jgi:hypothetical protein